jgi:hypothetical protein
MYRSTFFLTSALDGGEWSASRPGHFTFGERASGTHWIGGSVDPRADLDNLEKRKFLNLPGLELRPLSLPPRKQSLYRLLYAPVSYVYIYAFLHWDNPFTVSALLELPPLRLFLILFNIFFILFVRKLANDY